MPTSTTKFITSYAAAANILCYDCYCCSYYYCNILIILIIKIIIITTLITITRLSTRMHPVVVPPTPTTPRTIHHSTFLLRKSWNLKRILTLRREMRSWRACLARCVLHQSPTRSYQPLPYVLKCMMDCIIFHHPVLMHTDAIHYPCDLLCTTTTFIWLHECQSCYHTVAY